MTVKNAALQEGTTYALHAEMSMYLVLYVAPRGKRIVRDSRTLTSLNLLDLK
ncbi:hypothetical protein [Paenibacillus sp. BGI2013]|uniref:hypothetical protein n=1 Tax=Paenibacillus sp. BGI2013 TaxID=2058902 RepID=UPI0015D5C3D1|nr:hypothetical protein [Paenibacillus sp. BGI2013]